jgi:hypothetical protein
MPDTALAAAVAVAFLYRRQTGEVALDAGCEFLAFAPDLVVLRPHQLEAGLAARPLSLPASVPSEAAFEPRPLRANQDENGQREQRDRQPAHGFSLAMKGC